VLRIGNLRPRLVRADEEGMRPRFSVVTRTIAVVFAFAGLGAGVGVWGSSSAAGALILLALAAVFLLVAIGLWTEFAWAWWLGLGIVLVTMALTQVFNIPGGVGPIWLAVALGFVASAVQGRRDNTSRTSR
jgi:hypothetical protein